MKTNNICGTCFNWSRELFYWTHAELSNVHKVYNMLLYRLDLSCQAFHTLPSCWATTKKPNKHCAQHWAGICYINQRTFVLKISSSHAFKTYSYHWPADLTVAKWSWRNFFSFYSLPTSLDNHSRKRLPVWQFFDVSVHIMNFWCWPPKNRQRIGRHQKVTFFNHLFSSSENYSDILRAVI